jgi:DNA helicase-4
MAKTWSPSNWGKKFTGACDWTLTLDEELLALSIEGKRHNATIQGSSPVILHRGIFWTDISLPIKGKSAVVVDGIPNAHGDDIRRAIDDVINARKREAKRQAEELRNANLRDRFTNALNALQTWRSKVLARVGQHNSVKLWIATETTQYFIDSKPELGVTAHEFNKMLRTSVIEEMLGRKTDDAKKAIAMWECDLWGVVQRRNERFTLEELKDRKSLFDRVESKPLTEEQARAVICFDNRVQVVASAGSGKTSTMVARAAYAIERGLVPAERIVMLAFNEAAARELGVRIKASLEAIGIKDVQVDAMTFHKFGSDIIGCATGEKRRVAAWVQTGPDIEKLSSLIDDLKDQDVAFRTNWDLFRVVFGRDIPRFGKKPRHEDWSSSTKRSGFQTLQGEIVKSLEEVTIADWLFYQGVKYEYETDYKLRTATSTHSQYQPDFYFPDIDVWHEHFALNAKGEAPIEFVGYLEGVKWKRRLHQENKTTLIETTSHQLWTGEAFKTLARELTTLGIKLDPNPDRAVRGRQPIEHKELAGLFRSFIQHTKSNSLTTTDLQTKLKNAPDDTFRFRQAMFLKLAAQVQRAWDEALTAERAIDFEDMLNMAAEHLEEGRWESPYDLVMVDEFQDASWVRARMVQALVNKPSRYLFAVGDDWQSINRFAAADISVMTGFLDWCPHGQLLRLERTFRCPQKLCDLSSTFVQKNPSQIRKKVVSSTPEVGPVIEAFQVEDYKQTKSVIEKYLVELHEEILAGTVPRGRNGLVSVYVLGRYKREEQFFSHHWNTLFRGTLDVSFKTVHSSKGAEADYVILPGMTMKGFPSIKVDDPVLALAMPGADTFPDAEERRLFYVALTRARRTAVLFTVMGRASEFLVELVADGFIQIKDVKGIPTEEKVCPSCRRGVLVQRKGPFGPFTACSSFPGCLYKEKIENARPRRRTS